MVNLQNHKRNLLKEIDCHFWLMPAATKTRCVMSDVGEINVLSKYSAPEEEWADSQSEKVIGCLLRWVDLQVWYGQREITSSRLSDLLSLLLVPASSAWQDQACPDHNYALTYLPARPPTTKNLYACTPPPCPAPPLIYTPLHLLYLNIIHHTYLFLRNTPLYAFTHYLMF